MNLAVWIKRKFADKALIPVRTTLMDQIPSQSTLVDIGCGTGDLLFRASNQIASGLGIDLSQPMIDYANQYSQKSKLNNLRFICSDIKAVDLKSYDVATSTLFLHSIEPEFAKETLSNMIANSKLVLVADYSSPKSFLGKIAVELDELISGHYRRFCQFRRRGGVPGMLNGLGKHSVTMLATPIDGINVWVIVGSK